MDFSNISNIAGLGASLVAIAAGVTAVFVGGVKIARRLDRLDEQNHTNGGSTMRDQNNRIEKQGQDNFVAITTLKASFDAHVLAADKDQTRVDRYMENYPHPAVNPDQPAP